MFTHSLWYHLVIDPVKKMNRKRSIRLCYLHGFMGGEIGQFIEWDYERPLDWFLKDYDNHQMVQECW